MKNMFFQPLRDHLQRMRSLPENTRKISMVITMVIASASLGVASWLMFTPLQDINIPPLDSGSPQPIADNNDQPLTAESQDQPTSHSRMDDASKIPEIGPANSFMESFKAVKDLIVSKDIQESLANPAKASRSWPQQMADASMSSALRLHALSLAFLGKLETLRVFVSQGALFSIFLLRDKVLLLLHSLPV